MENKILVIKSTIEGRKQYINNLIKDLKSNADGVTHYAEKDLYDWARVNAEEVARLAVQIQYEQKAIKDLEAMVTFLESEIK